MLHSAVYWQFIERLTNGVEHSFDYMKIGSSNSNKYILTDSQTCFRDNEKRFLEKKTGINLYQKQYLCLSSMTSIEIQTIIYIVTTKITEIINHY